jgi:chromosome segregation ATPase
MKLSLVCLFTMVILIAPGRAMAQSAESNVARPTSEQSLQDLVREMRQLRVMLQRMNATTYKSNVLLERLKLQQEQVSQMSRELYNIRDQLSEIRSHNARLKEAVRQLEASVELGTKHPEEVASLKGEIEMLNQREQRAAAREAQLANDLEFERAKLNDLNDRLNALELEMAPNRP